MNGKNRKKITINKILICIILSSSLIGNIAIAEKDDINSGQNWELVNFNGKNHNYSPQNEINDDIISTFGYFNIGDFIGDPRFVSESNRTYPDLDKLQRDYFKK